MKKYALLMALLTAPATFAQVRVTVDVPTFRFEVAPPLVVVEPGIQVVPNYEEEVFFVDGFYWTRRGDRWYRTRNFRGGWAEVHTRYVPPGLVRIPAGRYRRWRAEERREERHEAREREREWRERERERADIRDARHEVREEKKHEHQEERREERREEREDEYHRASPPGRGKHDDHGRGDH